MEFNRKTIRSILLIITFAIVLYWLFQNLHLIPQFIKSITDFLSPFIIGCGFAYIINLPTRFFEQHLFGKEWKKRDNIRLKIKRPLSLLLSIITILGILSGIMIIIIPELVSAIQTLVHNLPDAIQRAQAWLKRIDVNSPEVTNFVDSIGYSIQELSSMLSGWLTDVVTKLINSTIDYSVSVIRFIFSFFIGLIFSIYLIGQKEKIGTQATALLYAIAPETFADRVKKFFTRANRAFSSFLSGQVLEAFVLGGLMTAALLIFNFPYAILVGVLIGITAVIPILGAWIGGAIGAVLMMTDRPRTMVYFLITFLIVQQFEGNVIYPRVVGKKVGLPAIWVLVAVTLGGSLGGVLGAFFSIPIASLIYEYTSEMVTRRIRKNSISAEKIQFSNGCAETAHAIAGDSDSEEHKEYPRTWWDRVLDAIKHPADDKTGTKKIKNKENGKEKNNIFNFGIRKVELQNPPGTELQDEPNAAAEAEVDKENIEPNTADNCDSSEINK